MINIHKHCGIYLLVVVLMLLTLGYVMLWSTTGPAARQMANPYNFVGRQGIWIVLGLVGMIVAACYDYNHYQKHAWWIYGMACFMLFLTLIPHIGANINGARRWIRLGSITLQASEFGKLATVILISHWLTLYYRKLQTWNWGFVFPWVLAVVPILLIGVAPDLGTATLLGMVVLAMMFIAGTRMRYLVPGVVTALGCLTVAVVMMPERLARIFAFLWPELNKTGKGYQVYQGLIALGSGGMNGVGLGESRQKFKYIPEAHTDFIFPVIGEELGLWATLLIVFAFLVLMMSGLMIVMTAKNKFGQMLASGITLMICLQAIINIGVVTSMIPNKGMPLPFISYAGNNLLINLIGIGILLNIYRQGNYVPDHDPLTVPEYTPKV
ncbi:MAG: putative lipid II flippase FtsW [Verrucomicrobiae bacterium]|nr:putative lipid II flippase FtsW [Verrucomicrobiae bacterium]